MRVRIQHLLRVLSYVTIIAARRDTTSDPDAVGGDVVRAVLSLIRQSVDNELGTDTNLALSIAQYMREMAYVESLDGAETTMPNARPMQGIWRISQMVANVTREFAASDSYLSDVIQQYHDTQWNNISDTDLLKPINSGLAVRIYLLHLYQMNLTLGSFTDAEKASYWAQHFNNGANITTWTDRVNLLRSEVDVCRVNTDIVFVVDSSGSIRDSYQTVIQYVNNFTAGLLQTNYSNSRVGIIEYSDMAEIQLHLTSNHRRFLGKTQSLVHLGGGTNIPDALCLLQDMNWRSNVSVLRIAIVITDGQSRGTTSRCNISMGSEGTLESTARELHDYDPHITVSVVGVNNRYIDRRQLEVIVGERGFLDLLDSLHYTLLEQNARHKSYFICHEETQSIQIGVTQQGSLPNGAVARLSVSGPLQDHEEVTIRVCVNQGIIAIFGSFKYSNPNSALNDFEARLNVTFRCHTINTTLSSSSSRTKRQAGSQTSTEVYITIVGDHEMESEFSIRSEYGNVILDTDECERDFPPCGANGVCHNTDGSYFCICHEGYEGEHTCTNINECALGAHTCGENEECMDNPGNYTCKCSEGYEWQGQMCTGEMVGFQVIYVAVLSVLAPVVLAAAILCICVARTRN